MSQYQNKYQYVWRDDVRFPLAQNKTSTTKESKMATATNKQTVVRKWQIKPLGKMEIEGKWKEHDDWIYDDIMMVFTMNGVIMDSNEMIIMSQLRHFPLHHIYKLCLISQKLSDEFSSYCTKWRVIMTACSSQNAILIELPESGQIGPKWAKFHQFYKLCPISQKISDEFSSYCTKWRVIMTAFSSQNAILIESPKGGQIGQKWAKFCQF